jgi:hypothetical protein
MPTTISPPTTLKFIQKEKNYVIGVKNQSVHNHQKECVHSAQANTGLNVHYAQNARLCTRKSMHTSMNDTFMDLVSPSTTSGPTPNMI